MFWQIFLAIVAALLFFSFVRPLMATKVFWKIIGALFLLFVLLVAGIVYDGKQREQAYKDSQKQSTDELIQKYLPKETDSTIPVINSPSDPYNPGGNY